MTVRKTDIPNSSWRLTSKMSDVTGDTTVSRSKLTAILNKMEADPKLGKRGADAFHAAYDAAKKAVGGDPKREDIRKQLDKAIGSLTNERAQGRVNDGYVDKHEASLVKGDVAAALYKYVDGSDLNAHRPVEGQGVHASKAQIKEAYRTLEPVVDAGFKIYKALGDDDGEGPAVAFRNAAQKAGLSSEGRAALLTALNGATSRGDGDGYPDAAAVKALLKNAVSKLATADGAKVVDFAHPERAAKSKKDGVTTGLELDRTPAATGMTSVALLKFASTL